MKTTAEKNNSVITDLSFQVSGGWNRLILVGEGDCKLRTIEGNILISGKILCWAQVAWDGEMVDSATDMNLGA